MAPREPAVAKEALEDDARHAIDVEKLGRQRPDVFPTTWHEVAFVASILGSLAMAVSAVVSARPPARMPLLRQLR